jgi:hypothetical protein
MVTRGFARAGSHRSMEEALQLQSVKGVVHPGAAQSPTHVLIMAPHPTNSPAGV